MMSARSSGVLSSFFWTILLVLILGESTMYSMNQSMNSVDQIEADIDDDQDEDDDISSSEPSVQKVVLGRRSIRSIHIEGNLFAPTQAIMSKVPYSIGHIFDASKTGQVINNINDLGFFKNIQLFGQPVGDDQIDIIIVVDEKKRLSGVEFIGNNHLSYKEIEKKIDFSRVLTVDEADLPRYIGIIKKLYRDKDYHHAQVTAQLHEKNGAEQLVFKIQEGSKTLVKRVLFQGNEAYTSKKLRSLIYTREDWILSFIDRAGSYQPEMIEADKQIIENYYQSNGFLNARVIDAQIKPDETGQELIVTYYIQEGDQYSISEITVPGNDIISEEFLAERLPIKVGDLYSKEKIRDTIEGLRLLWGDFGYIYADIEPSIQPDDETKTVKLGFFTELGPQVYLESIRIIGNEKTEDKVIRRQLTLQEGGILTTKGMEESKNRVELLGYFDQRGGVNWKINRIGKDRASLDLILKEVKTGRAEVNIGFGGSPRDASSPIESLSVRGALSDSNLFGQGIQFSMSGEYAKREVNYLLNITQPWLFDRPISAGFDIFTKRTSYDEFFYMEKNIQERIAGGAFNVGFVFLRASESTWITRFIVEDVKYTNTAVNFSSASLNLEQKEDFQGVINRRFQSGTFVGWALNVTKDRRNHPLHPSRGYQWQALSKTIFPSAVHDFGFFKADFDASWYTPLIGERNLIFMIHGHLGLIAPLKNKTVPFRELYNIGGPATVRGFEFGEIGPRWVAPQFPGRSSPLGATKAFWVNAELIFPISADFSMKGAVFYDGGAGWDTIDSSQILPSVLRNNHFSYRHAVGVGIRVLRPTPIKIDWGFKLDRRKGEDATRVHFTAYQEF